MSNNDNPIVRGSRGSRALRRSIQLAIASTILASGLSHAVLRDHGPADPTLVWPLWYRDTNNLPLGLCKSQTPSPNPLAAGPMCFPLVNDPAGFPGNIGPEIFYNTINFVYGRGTDFGFRYVAGLEASYLPLGVPVHGTETVFARVRIAFSIHNANQEGTYTVTHPYGVRVFNNVKAVAGNTIQGAKASIFDTVDVPLGVMNDFESALGGPVGPWITWSGSNPDGMTDPGETLSVTNLAGVTEQFVGDPNILHTFKGSPFGTDFIRIDGPPGSAIGGFDGNNNPIDFVFTNVANIQGQIWTAPIATATKVKEATYAAKDPVFGTEKNSVDLWVEAAPGNKLIAADDAGQVPSLELLENALEPGVFHGHIEFPAGTPIPTKINVANASSPLPITVAASPVDSVEIASASFDTSSRVLSVIAQSSDERLPLPTLALQGVSGVPGVVNASDKFGPCAPGATENPSDQCYSVTLPGNVEVPPSVSVFSSKAGIHADHVVDVVGTTQDVAPAPSATSLAVPFTVNSTGDTVIAGLSVPAGQTLIVTQQPQYGSIVVAGGTVSYRGNGSAPVPVAPATTVPESFKYVLQDLTPTGPSYLPAAQQKGAVSTQATVNLGVQFVSTPPISNADTFAARVNVANTPLDILKNDVATANTTLNKTAAGIRIISPAITGTTTLADGSIRHTLTGGAVVIKNTNGTISYQSAAGRPNLSVDNLVYQVQNSAGQWSPNTNLAITLFTSSETISYSKLQQIGGKWTIVGTTNWAAASLTNTQISCSVTAGTLNPVQALPALITVDAAPIIADATGKFQAAPAGTTPTLVNNAGAIVTCRTSNNGAAGNTPTVK